ncbi:MAG: right-handed parallel beta-helix repeat-containing protein [Phycisphaerae bacterium]|nr:right-handed parallel beta-helix repeat-containing protein [Phycisphaerae bacterium]
MRLGNRIGIACVCSLALAAVCPAAVITVCQDAPPCDYNNIQDAIDASSDGDVILVYDGTYTGHCNKNLDYYDYNTMSVRNLIVRSTGGPENCEIDCEQSGRAFHFHHGEDSTSVVDGFTITGGNANSGGGMYNEGSSPTVTNCTFIGNTANGGAHTGGGGMASVLGSNPKVTNCRFSYNDAVTQVGGGMLNNEDSNPLVINCTFNANTANKSGGAMVNVNNSNPLVVNCGFSGNAALGVDVDGNGGAIHIKNASPTVVNCTFSRNSAADEGGGMHTRLDSSPMVTNCIFWENTDNNGVNMDESAQIHVHSGTPQISYNCIQGLDTFEGNGNIGVDPLFFDPDGPDNDPDTWADNDYRLAFASPCIDAGDTTALQNDLNDLYVDLGGLGRRLDDRCTPDTGIPAGLVPVTVDMGAYEYRLRGDVNGDGTVSWRDIDPFVALMNTGCL